MPGYRRPSTEARNNLISKHDSDLADIAKEQGWPLDGTKVVGPRGNVSASFPENAYPYSGSVGSGWGSGRNWMRLEDAIREIGLEYCK